MSTILESRRVSFAAGRRLLVDKVDLSLEAGTFTVVIGPNGAGKSTLLKLLCGELAPTDGSVLLNGCPIRSIPAWRLAHLRAVMPQASDLGFPFKAVEVAGLGVQEGPHQLRPRAVALQVVARGVAGQLGYGDDLGGHRWRAFRRGRAGRTSRDGPE